MLDRIFLLALCMFTSPEPDFKVLWPGAMSQGGLWSIHWSWGFGLSLFYPKLFHKNMKNCCTSVYHCVFKLQTGLSLK